MMSRENRPADPKAFTKYLKEWNTGAIEVRDPVTYTLPEAINEVETYFSYNYGDYDVQTSEKYSFTDTISISFSALPMTEAEVATFTEQVRSTGVAQMNDIPGTSDKFYYYTSLGVISQTTTSAQVAVSSYFGKGEVTWVNPAPLPSPVTFSIPYPLDADNSGSCADPDNTTIKGAPRRLSDDIRALLPSQQPNPRTWYQKVYFTDQINFFALSFTHLTGGGNNYFDDQYRAKNPNDANPGDGVNDFLVYRHQGPNLNNTDYSCPYTCIDNTKYNYYGQNIWKILNDGKSYYNRNYILNFDLWFNTQIYKYSGIGEINWQSRNIEIANYIIDDTRSKVPFPGTAE